MRTPRTRTSPVISPPSRRRKALGWIGFAIGLIVAGTLIGLLADTDNWQPLTPFDPTSAGPDGTLALSTLLEEHGVEVIIARDAETARRAAGLQDTTLVLPDDVWMSAENFSDLAATADRVVVPNVGARGLRLLFPGANPIGFGTLEPVAPQCSSAVAERAGPLVVGSVFSLPQATFGSGSTMTACYPTHDGYALLMGASALNPSGDAVVIDGTELFTNEYLAENGNASLALQLLGQTSTLVWFAPGSISVEDPEANALGSLTPPWVTPVMVLLIVAVITAGIWRARRFGPLVAERLPVWVRASETAEGRGRLYADGHDAPHAAQQLRAASVGRLRRKLGRGASSTTSAAVDDLAAVLAERRGFDADALRAILRDTIPHTDRELVDLIDQLDAIEDAVSSASRERNTP